MERNDRVFPKTIQDGLESISEKLQEKTYGAKSGVCAVTVITKAQDWTWHPEKKITNHRSSIRTGLLILAFNDAIIIYFILAYNNHFDLVRVLFLGDQDQSSEAVKQQHAAPPLRLQLLIL